MIRSIVCSLALVLGGCASNVKVTRINSEQAKPNNVWVFFTVEEDDEPVAGLTAEDFEIHEDEELVSKFESKQVILNPDVAAVMYTLLLLDMSGSVTESGQADALVDAAQKFTEKVGKTQKVGVYAFDGEEKIHPVVPFTESGGAVSGGLDQLRGYKAKDPSTNLHGAVQQGLVELHESLQKDKRPLKFGTLVVFTDGTDRAGRVTKDEMMESMDQDEYKRYEKYAIGVGAELEEDRLKDVGRDGTELASDQENVESAFEKVADRIDKQSKRFYLLSYCTPARKGEHSVTIVAIVKNEKGKKSGEGETSWEFDAEKFGPPPECDPNREPKFSLERVDPPEEDDEDDLGGPKKAGKKKKKAGGGPAGPGSGSSGKPKKKPKSSGSVRSPGSE